jgi:hypothetical protein
MYNFGFREEAALNVEGFPFRQIFQFASSGLVSLGAKMYIHLAVGGKWR